MLNWPEKKLQLAAHIRTTERDTLKFRLLALLVISFVLFLKRDTADLPLGTALAVGYLIYTGFVHLVLFPRLAGVPLVYAMLVADLAAAFSAVHLFGLDTVVVALPALVVVYHAIYLGYWGSIPAAILASVGLFGVIMPQEVEVSDFIIAEVPLFFILALLVGYATQQRFRDQERQLALERLWDVELKVKRILDTMNQMDRELDIQRLGQDLVQSAVTVTGFPVCALLLPDAEQQRLVVTACSVAGVVNATEPLGEATLGAVAVRERRVVVGRVDAPSPAWIEKALDGASGPVTIVACPLGGKEGFQGIFYLLDPVARSLSPQEAGRIEEFARGTGKVYLAAKFYTDARTQSRLLTDDLEKTAKSLERLQGVWSRPALAFDPLLLEPQRRRTILLGQEIALSDSEFDLLYVLAENAGTPVAEATLIRQVWRNRSDPRGNVVDVTVHRLRRKLSMVPGGAEMICTVRGKGYMFMPLK